MNPGQSTAAESEALVLAARVDFATDEAARFEAALSGVVDWDRLADAARAFRVNGLLFKHLSEAGRASLAPAPVLRRLEKESRAQAMRGLKDYARLAQILDAATDERIDILLLKGAYLARWIYRDLSLRPFNDIDMSCRAADLPKLSAILHRMGYEQDKTVPRSRIHARIGAPKHHHLPPFVRPGWPCLEIHTDLTTVDPGRSVPMDGVWRRAQRLDWDGRRAFCLGVEDQVLHLSVHLAYHLESGFIDLVWFSDIREIVRRTAPSLDWARVVAMVEDLGFEKEVGGLWRRLRSDWNVPIPPNPLLSSQAAEPNTDIHSWLERQAAGISGRSFSKRHAQILKTGKNELSGKDRILFIWKQAFPDRDFIRWRYGLPADQNVFFYYFYHVYRGCRRILPGLSSFLGRRSDS